jgi:hypothetical protein
VCGGALVTLVALACSPFEEKRETASPTDAGADASDAAPRGCASAAKADFCEDFEADQLIGIGWSEVNVDGTGSAVVYDTSLSVSGGRSARMQVASSASCTYASLRREFLGAVRGVRFSAFVRPFAQLGSGSTAMANVHLGRASDARQCNLILVVDADAAGQISGGFVLVQPTAPGVQRTLPLTSFPTTETWRELTYDVGEGPGGVPTLSVRVDGASAFDAPLELGECAFGAGVDVQVGLYCMDHPAVMLVDDVRATLTR